MPRDRVYTEDEIHALIERAARLQADDMEAGAGPGLTLQELEQVADSAGIDPRYLRLAASDLRSGWARRAPSRRDATHIYAERLVPGELEPEAWEDVVAELRHRYDSSAGAMWGMPGVSQGEVQQIGRSVEWKHTSMAGIETRVMVQPRDGQLRVRLSQRVGMMNTLAESLFYALFVVLFAGPFAFALSGAVFVALLATLLTFVVAAPLIYVADTAWRGRKERELEGLADTVTHLIRPRHAAGPPVGQRPAGEERAGPSGRATSVGDADWEDVAGRAGVRRGLDLPEEATRDADAPGRRSEQSRRRS